MTKKAKKAPQDSRNCNKEKHTERVDLAEEDCEVPRRRDTQRGRKRSRGRRNQTGSTVKEPRKKRTRMVEEESLFEYTSQTVLLLWRLRFCFSGQTSMKTRPLPRHFHVENIHIKKWNGILGPVHCLSVGRQERRRGEK